MPLSICGDCRHGKHHRLAVATVASPEWRRGTWSSPLTTGVPYACSVLIQQFHRSAHQTIVVLSIHAAEESRSFGSTLSLVLHQGTNIYWDVITLCYVPSVLSLAQTFWRLHVHQILSNLVLRSTPCTASFARPLRTRSSTSTRPQSR